MLLNLFFLLPWAILAFFLVRFVASTYFQAGERANLVAAAVVAAFVVGALLPNVRLSEESRVVAQAPPTPTPSPKPRRTLNPDYQGDPNADKAPPVVWDEKRGAFVQSGRVLKAAKIWQFKGTTDGFTTSPGAHVRALPDRGLGVSNDIYGTYVRTPPNLALDGRAFPIVIIRLSRTKRGDAWDPTLYYTTDKHEDNPGFFARVYRGKNPPVGKTVTLVFNMANLPVGGQDWTSSRIQQFRLQTDDQPGGEFAILQVAVTEPLVR
jgi:hypothetical protein